MEIGRHVYADDCTTNSARISYARVLIEMDITDELPINITVQDDPAGRVFDQEIDYDWVP